MNEKWETPYDGTPEPPEPPDPPPPPRGGFFSPAKPVSDRVNDAIEAWYADHYRRAAVAGRAPISVDEKSDLIKAITAAIQSEH